MEQEPPACEVRRTREKKDRIERIAKFVQRVSERGQPQSLQRVPQERIAARDCIVEKPAQWEDLTADIALKQNLASEKWKVENG